MAEKSDIPLFAIGGINRDVCMDVKDKGIPGVCICSAVISSEDPGKETAYFAGVFK
jgi:thiamine monophosphate synthase